PTPADHVSPRNAPNPDAPPLPSDRSAGGADAAAPVGSQVDESPGVGGPPAPKSGSGSSGAAPDTGGGEASRSPELIESGMVYVDPEIGSPPTAAGWDASPALVAPVEPRSASTE